MEEKGSFMLILIGVVWAAASLLFLEGMNKGFIEAEKVRSFFASVGFFKEGFLWLDILLLNFISIFLILLGLTNLLKDGK